MANNVGHSNKCSGYAKILCKRKNTLVGSKIDLQNYKVLVGNLDLLSFVIGTISVNNLFFWEEIWQI
jgi:hypothetical protein